MGSVKVGGVRTGFGGHFSYLKERKKKYEPLLHVPLSLFQLVLMHVSFGPRPWLWSHSPGFEICSSIPSLTPDKLQLLGEEELLDCCVHYIKHA